MLFRKVLLISYDKFNLLSNLLTKNTFRSLTIYHIFAWLPFLLNKYTNYKIQNKREKGKIDKSLCTSFFESTSTRKIIQSSTSPTRTRPRGPRCEGGTCLASRRTASPSRWALLSRIHCFGESVPFPAFRTHVIGFTPCPYSGLWLNFAFLCVGTVRAGERARIASSLTDDVDFRGDGDGGEELEEDGGAQISQVIHSFLRPSPPVPPHDTRHFLPISLI